LELSISRVIFGIGSLKRLDGEVDFLGRKRVLVLSVPGRKDGELLARMLGDLTVGLLAEAEMHVAV
jgi:maleylacetate reductase